MYLLGRVNITQDSTNLPATYTGVIPFVHDWSFSIYETIEAINKQLTYFPEAEVYNDWESFHKGITANGYDGVYPKTGYHFILFKVDSIVELHKKERESKIVTSYPQVKE